MPIGFVGFYIKELLIFTFQGLSNSSFAKFIQPHNLECNIPRISLAQLGEYKNL
jgi:hypothetical protein